VISTPSLCPRPSGVSIERNVAKRRRWEEELERELERQGKPKLAELDPEKRAGVVEEIQRSSGNKAFQQVVGSQQLQREAAPTVPKLQQRETRTYMAVKGIPGPVLEKAHRGQFDVLKFSHKIVSPRDVASGQPTGVRRHSAATVVLPTSEGTVPFRDAVTKNLTLPEVVIYRPSQTITMINVNVTEVEDLDEDQVLLKLVYEKITWSTPGEGGGQTSEDTWAAPGSK
jgi:type VI protein secretion system component Hcp